MTRGYSHPHGWARAATVALAAGAALLAATGTASAHPSDNPQKSTGVHPDIVGDHATANAPLELGRVFGTANGHEVVSSGGPGTPTSRIFITFAPGSQDPAHTAVLSYCIDVGHDLGSPDAPYTEVPFTQAGLSADAQARILWILAHSKPNVADADVLRMAGVTGVSTEDTGFVVYSATQAAIWHFSDSFNLTAAKDQDQPRRFSTAQYGKVQALYTFLISHAVAQTEAPTLSIAPATAQGMVGDLFGPFTVSTNIPEVTLRVSDGATLLGPDKTTPITTATDGGTFFVKPGAAGTPTVTASGTGSVAVGRAFVVLGDFKPEETPQKLLLANLTPKQVSATVKLTATTPTPTTPAPTTTVPAPTPTSPALAATGASPMPKVGLAVLLLLAGTGLTVAARRRRHGHHA